jgi:hypothetical protein
MSGGNYMHRLPSQSVYLNLFVGLFVSFVWFSQQTAIISLTSTSQLIVVMEKRCVSVECLNII